MKGDQALQEPKKIFYPGLLGVVSPVVRRLNQHCCAVTDFPGWKRKLNHFGPIEMAPS